MSQHHTPMLTQVARNGRLCFGPEKREHARLAYDCPAHWRIDQAETLDHVGWAREASRTGASFTMRAVAPPATGDSLRLTFRLDNCYEWLVAPQAVVRWSRRLNEGLWDVGVQFATAHDRTQRPLDKKPQENPQTAAAKKRMP